MKSRHSTKRRTRSNTVKEADRDLPRSSQAEGQHPPLIVVGNDYVGADGSWFLHSSSFGEVLASPEKLYLSAAPFPSR